MISSALYRFFGMVQISLRGFLPLLIWTRYLGLDHRHCLFELRLCRLAEIEADMAAQLARVREMERNGELKPIPEVSATTQ